MLFLNRRSKLFFLSLFLSLFLILVTGCAVPEKPARTSEADGEQLVQQVQDAVPAYIEDAIEKREGDQEIKQTPELVVDKSLQRFAVRMFKYGIDPEIIEVARGNRVMITVTAMDQDFGLAIPDFGINQLFKLEEPAQVSFIADKSGEFGFFCSSNCNGNRDSMKGKIVVG